MKKIVSFVLSLLFIVTLAAPCFSGGTLPFADVESADWYADAVRYVYENGLMVGVSDGEFAPGDEMSRAMLVTVLWRLEGSPATAGSWIESECRELGIPVTLVEREHHIHTPGECETCVSPQTCTECGAVITPARGHVWVAAADEAGKAVWYCKICGESKN